MGAYYRWVTPEIPERNPFVAIAVMVLTLALVAGVAMRLGVNSVVAAICVGIAIIGTWLLLSPQIESLESALLPAGGGVSNAPGIASTSAGVSAFSSAPVGEAAPRERLRSAPRIAVGFDGETSGAASAPARLPSMGADRFSDSVAPVQALGQLPQDASALQVSTTVEPAGNISGAYTLGQFEIRGASRRGSDHVILDDPRQDDYVVASAANGRYLVVVLADGESTAENAQYGAYWASRILAQTIDQHLREGVPGIEKMLTRTRDEVTELFEMRFTDGSKMRTIATRLVGLIAPVDGGPAAGFRVGNGDILFNGESGWQSIFGSNADAEAVFPRSIEADVAPLDLDLSCLLLASGGVVGPIRDNADVAASFAETLATPASEVEFDQMLSFPLEQARGDRTAVGVWFTPTPPASS